MLSTVCRRDFEGNKNYESLERTYSQFHTTAMARIPDGKYQGASGGQNQLTAERMIRTHVLGPLDEPAALKPVVPEIVHPIQYGITPTRLLLPHSDTEILSYNDDDISSIRDGYTAWVMSDASTTRERHMACTSSAVFAFRKANERRNRSPQSKYRFDTSVPKPSAGSDADQRLKLASRTQTW